MAVQPIYEWELTWLSSPGERYEGVVESKAIDALAENKIEIDGTFGGVDMLTDVADNGLVIVCEHATARLAMRLVEGAVKHEVRLHKGAKR